MFKEPPPDPEPKEQIRRKKRTIELGMKERVVQLRFGDEDFERPVEERLHETQEKYSEISKVLGLHYKTVVAICSQWQKDGSVEKKPP